MNIDEIMAVVQSTVKIHESCVGIEFIEYNDKGFVMGLKFYSIEKILGVTEVASIINRVLKKYNTQLISLECKNQI